MHDELWELQLQGHELMAERIKLAEVLLQMKQSDEVISQLTDLDEDRLAKDGKRRRRMTIGLAFCQKVDDRLLSSQSDHSVHRLTTRELCISWRKSRYKEPREQRLQRRSPNAIRCKVARYRPSITCRQSSTQLIRLAISFW